MKPHILILTVLFAVGMILVGQLRLAGMSGGVLFRYGDLATPLYVVLTVALVFILTAAGVKHNRIGFGLGFKPITHVGLALAAAAALQVSAPFLAQVWEGFFGEERDLTRFTQTADSLDGLMLLLLMSWTIAAFGEEIAFRILLMRGIATGLGDGRIAVITALFLQAAIFGLLHAYQGYAGIAGAAVSGLVFGVVVLAAHGSIWPAALAHGMNNSISIFQIYVDANQ